MGIWATWVPVGTVSIFILAPMMADALGWQSIWWLGAVFSLLILLAYAVFMRLPPWIPESPQYDSRTSILGELKFSFGVLKNRSIWLLGLVFACYTFTFMGLRTYYPTFLSEGRGYSLSQAAFIASIATVMVLFSAPVAGWISDRIGSRRLVFSIPFLVFSAMLFFPFNIISWQIILFMVLQGLVAGAIPTAVFAAAPEIMIKPELAGLGLAVVMFGQNLGFFIGPIFLGNMVENLGWVLGGYSLIPICLLGFLVGWRLKVR
jgi:MFS family permease